MILESCASVVLVGLVFTPYTSSHLNNRDFLNWESIPPETYKKVSSKAKSILDTPKLLFKWYQYKANFYVIRFEKKDNYPIQHFFFILYLKNSLHCLVSLKYCIECVCLVKNLLAPCCQNNYTTISNNAPVS